MASKDYLSALRHANIIFDFKNTDRNHEADIRRMWNEMLLKADAEYEPIWKATRDAVEHGGRLDDLWVGHLFTRCPTCLCVKTPSGTPLIVIDGTYKYAVHNLLAAWLISQSYDLAKSTFSENVFCTDYVNEDSSKDILIRTARMFGRYNMPGSGVFKEFLDSITEVRRGLPQELLESLDLLHHSAMFLSLLHEFSHILLGHMDGNPTLERWNYLDLILFLRQQEIEADRLATRSALRSFTEANARGLAFISIDLMFGVIEFLQYFRRTGPRCISTHPEPIERWKDYRRELGDQVLSTIDIEQYYVWSRQAIPWFRKAMDFVVAEIGQPGR
jgi:hypothetical protein